MNVSFKAEALSPNAVEALGQLFVYGLSDNAGLMESIVGKCGSGC